MDSLSYKTISANKATVNKEWLLIDADSQVLGRLASQVAKMLLGKHKTSYTPHVDCGDNIIIINAEKVKLTGKKMTQKQYLRHTGYPGGQRVTTPREMMEKNPALIFLKAVKGMLPKNRLGRQLFHNMHVYVGPEHKQEAQQPRKIDLNL